MTDATDVAPIFVGKKNVSTEVDGLSSPLEPPPGARQFN
jgi:hypothetical protein